jgi:hypothetical protein
LSGWSLKGLWHRWSRLGRHELCAAALAAAADMHRWIISRVLMVNWLSGWSLKGFWHRWSRLGRHELCAAAPAATAYMYGWPEPYVYAVYTDFTAGITCNIRLIYTFLANPTDMHRWVLSHIFDWLIGWMVDPWKAPAATVGMHKVCTRHQQHQQQPQICKGEYSAICLIGRLVYHWKQVVRHKAAAAAATKNRFVCHILGLARTVYIRCVYGAFGREITKYTVIYGVHTVLASPTHTWSIEWYIDKQQEWNLLHSTFRG